MVDRIKALMEFKGLTSTQLADQVGVPRATVSHILSGRNNPSLDVVQKMLHTFREVSVDWLLLGEGAMLTDLASGRINAVAPSPAKTQPEAASQNASPPVAQPPKVQDLPLAGSTNNAAGKTVEQVLVFYSDQTFTAYKPS
ncbi:helix-turn-helix transcriptional regulator [Pontibacter sp. CAU 1760]